jgi:hypothetical protein
MLIECLEIFSLWCGFADPPSRSARLVITRQGERFVRKRLPEETTDEVEAEMVNQLIDALAQPAVPELEPAMFEIAEAALRLQYNSIGPMMVRRIWLRSRWPRASGSRSARKRRKSSCYR